MIFLGADHAGFELKEAVKHHLKLKNIEFRDLGTHSKKSVDYPDFAHKVAHEVAQSGHKGILVCGSGIGMSMAANKVPGSRAALCTDEFFAEMSRKHNDANILVLAGRATEHKTALKMVDIFFKTKFEGGVLTGRRHKRRVKKMMKLHQPKKAKPSKK